MSRFEEDPFAEFEVFTRGRETEQPETSRQTARRARSRSVAPQTEILGETLRNINTTLENINQNILINRLQPQPQQPQQLPQKNLSMNFEQYQNYLGAISYVNEYINKQISKIEQIDFDFIGSILDSDTLNNNVELINILERYNTENIESVGDIDRFFEFLNTYFLDATRLEIKPLPNIDPEIKKREILKKIPTLPGTDNVLFTKFKSDKKTSYDSVIGDYTRLDIPKAEPCKLRYNSKDPQNPFQVTQAGKKFVFNNIGLAKSFCLNGGTQADFIVSKNQIDYDRKYKNQYYQTAVLR